MLTYSNIILLGKKNLYTLVEKYKTYKNFLKNVRNKEGA